MRFFLKSLVMSLLRGLDLISNSNLSKYCEIHGEFRDHSERIVGIRRASQDVRDREGTADTTSYRTARRDRIRKRNRNQRDLTHKIRLVRQADNE